MIKRGAKKLLSSMGLELRRLPRAAEAAERAAAMEATNRATFRGALRNLARLGLSPQTVIDVGVAFATPDLYREFPDARMLLIEPLREFEPHLKRICNEYRAEYVLAAAGETAGNLMLNVHTEQPDCSSVFAEAEGKSADGVPRQVPVVTIDEECQARGLQGPYLLKVDVQGAELKVLAGAQRVLTETEVVILEVTLFGTMIGGPQAVDVVKKMEEYGFVVYDLWGMLYRPYDGALAQVDIAFVQKEGRFRATHVFATPQQREALGQNFGVQ